MGAELGGLGRGAQLFLTAAQRSGTLLDLLLRAQQGSIDGIDLGDTRGADPESFAAPQRAGGSGCRLQGAGEVAAEQPGEADDKASHHQDSGAPYRQRGAHLTVDQRGRKGDGDVPVGPGATADGGEGIVAV